MVKAHTLYIGACFLSVVLTLPVAANPAVHTIDAAQEKCLKTAHATMPRAKCYSTAAEAWEKDVEKTYGDLLKTMPSTSRTSLEASQSAWEKYRDAEFDLIAQMYNSRKGTGYISVRIILRMDIVKQRALRLEEWLASFST